ncbi:urease accessory protein UreD [Reinekea blandensis]|uniref:Urease accessory protein UreD n=1 Tax=Reinekea blandensis MED297 TaxID=314283 RepID=A4BBQ7_9GAMM|nr:urease accessory protein UreD [Reinekea blandensis]EAR10392.1 Urease accessory protein UreD [Reinekea sp. MED297] [Reinekea blandensis MED297]
MGHVEHLPGTTTEHLDSVKQGQWQAFLSLTFAPTARGTRLVEKAHRGPLYIQKPFYPEGLSCPHAYLLHPPGGLVSGDTLSVSVNVREKAQVLITTPGAGRMYRAREQQARQRQINEMTVANDASLEWLPMEAIVFPDAQVEMSNRIDLTGSAKVIYWDVLSLGLPAMHQTFEQGRLNQNLQIVRDGRLVLQERLVLNDSNRALLDAEIGLRALPIQGVMVAGPFTEIPEATLEALQERTKAAGFAVGVTLIAGFVVIRLLNDCSERARQLFEQCWALLRPALLGREACVPRIWNT